MKSMNESNEIMAMRKIQWRRAKGELEGLLETYFSEYLPSGHKVENGFDNIYKIIKEFIENMELNLY
jgi:hypothetical protein